MIAALVIFLIFAIPSFFPEKDFRAKYESYDLSTNIGASSSVKTYDEYLKLHASSKNPDREVSVNVLDYNEGKSYGVHIEKAYKGKDVVYTEEESSVSWNVEVPEEGFYNISMEYIGVGQILWPFSDSGRMAVL